MASREPRTCEFGCTSGRSGHYCLKRAQLVHNHPSQKEVAAIIIDCTIVTVYSERHDNGRMNRQTRTWQ